MKKRFLFLYPFLLLLSACSFPVQKLCLNKVEEEIISEPVEEIVSSRKLTLLVYMAADNDLERYALENLKAMERADYESMNVLVLLDRAEGFDETEGDWTDTRLFEIIHDESPNSAIKSHRLDCPQLGISSTENTELDMSNPLVLKNFIRFGKNQYPAEKYILIIWGHGMGWQAATIDDRSGTYMSIAELGDAVRDESLSIIGFDTCFGGVFENLYELKDCAEYTVACPGVTPSSGWNYKSLLERIDDERDSQSIAVKMAESSSVQTCVFINSKLSDVMEKFEIFSKTLAQSVVSTSTREDVFQSLINCNSYTYTQYPCDLYLDMYSVGMVFLQAGNNTLQECAEQLRNAVNNCVLFSNNGTCGLGIYLIGKTAAGVVSSSHSQKYLRDSIQENKCSFVLESQWWVPTSGGNSGSLLDKLFYTSF